MIIIIPATRDLSGINGNTQRIIPTYNIKHSGRRDPCSRPHRTHTILGRRVGHARNHIYLQTSPPNLTYIQYTP